MGRFYVHNVLMIGPPESGKTLLARALTAVTIDEALDVTRIHSVADALPPATPLFPRELKELLTKLIQPGVLCRDLRQD